MYEYILEVVYPDTRWTAGFIGTDLDQMVEYAKRYRELRCPDAQVNVLQREVAAWEVAVRGA